MAEAPAPFAPVEPEPLHFKQPLSEQEQFERGMGLELHGLDRDDLTAMDFFEQGIGREETLREAIREQARLEFTYSGEAPTLIPGRNPDGSTTMTPLRRGTEGVRDRLGSTYVGDLPDWTNKELDRQRGIWDQAQRIVEKGTPADEDLLPGGPRTQADLARAVHDLSGMQPKPTGAQSIGRGLIRGVRGMVGGDELGQVLGIDSKGDERRIQESQLTEQLPPAHRKDEGWLEWAAVGAAENAPPMISSILAAYASGGLAAAGVGGLFNLAAVPAKIRAITQFGTLAGYWTAQTYPTEYVQFRRAGISEQTARPVALVSSMLQGLVENIEFDPILKPLGINLRTYVGGPFRAWLRREAVKVGKQYGKELTEEGVQSLISSATQRFAEHADGLAPKQGIGDFVVEAFGEAVEQMKQASGSLLLLMAPGAAKQTAQSLRMKMALGPTTYEVKDGKGGAPPPLAPVAPGATPRPPTDTPPADDQAARRGTLLTDTGAADWVKEDIERAMKLIARATERQPEPPSRKHFDEAGLGWAKLDAGERQYFTDLVFSTLTEDGRLGGTSPDEPAESDETETDTTTDERPADVDEAPPQDTDQEKSDEVQKEEEGQGQGQAEDVLTADDGGGDVKPAADESAPATAADDVPPPSTAAEPVDLDNLTEAQIQELLEKELTGETTAPPEADETKPHRDETPRPPGETPTPTTETKPPTTETPTPEAPAGETPEPEDPKVAAARKEIADAQKELASFLGQLHTGVDPRIAKPIAKMLAGYAKLGIYKLSDAVRELMKIMPEFVRTRADIQEAIERGWKILGTLDSKKRFDAPRLVRDVLKEIDHADTPDATEPERPVPGGPDQPGTRTPGDAGAPAETEPPGEVPDRPGAVGGDADGDAAGAGPGTDAGATGGGGVAGTLPTAPEGNTGPTVEPGDGAETATVEGVPAAGNFAIEAGDTLIAGGDVAKLKANIKAIETLKKIESQHRGATRDEQALLARYTGWGGLSQALDTRQGEAVENDQDWRYREAWKEKWYPSWKKIRGLLTDEEYSAAAGSTLNAHYTSREVITSMWAIAERLGFTGGTVLEPSAGVGHFFGLMPEHMAAASKLVGVELDSITGRILKLLYPAATTFNMAMEDAPIKPNSVDLVMGNPPFGSEVPRDAKERFGIALNTHNYFIARSIDAVRPGGIVMVVTSAFTMDAAADQRRYLAERAEFLGAIRLPNNAFKKNAGTEVVTDIVVLRKRDVSDTGLGQPWLAIDELKGDDVPKGIVVNEYYVARPGQMLGRPSLQGSMRGGGDEFTLEPVGDAPLDQQIAKAAEILPEGAMNVRGGEVIDYSQVQATAGIQEGSLVRQDDGSFGVVVEGKLVPAVEYDRRLSGKQRVKMEDYVGLRDSYQAHIALMQGPSTDDAVQESADALKGLYDTFIGRHGFVSGDEMLQLFGFDPNYWATAGLEKRSRRFDAALDAFIVDVQPAAVFTKRTIGGLRAPKTAATLDDAMNISLSWRARIDVDYMVDLTGTPKDDVTKWLDEHDRVLLNPATGYYESRDVYLGGFVRRKLDEARFAAKADPRYARNVQALEGVQPDPVTISGIRAALGAIFIPEDVIEDFSADLFGFDSQEREGVHVHLDPTFDRWVVNLAGFPQTSRVTTEYGVTAYWHGGRLFEAALNMKYPQITRKDVDGNTYLDVAATAQAEGLINQIKEAFDVYVQKTPSAASLIEFNYNETLNGWIPIEYDGSHLQMPGMDQSVRPRPNQKNAIWRMIREGFAMIAHAPGAGKTYTLCGAAMEMKRLGLANKPLIVVNNDTLEQFALSFRQLYPAANVLVAQKADLSTKNRKRFLASIAAGSFDAIVMAQSQFDLIAPDSRKMLQVQMELERQLLAIIDEATAREGKKSPTVKEAQSRLNRVRKQIARMQQLLAQRRDTAFTFDKLGIDALLMDEAHRYKKPPFVTKLTRLVGLSTESNPRSLSMFAKVRSIQALRGGKGVFLATGTPVTNTMGEAWHVMNVVAPQVLRHLGMDTFDRFMNTHAIIQPIAEMNAAGRWKMKPAVAKMMNGISLNQIVRTAWDVLTTQDLFDMLEAQGVPIPKKRGGATENVTIEITPETANIMDYLDEVYSKFEGLRGNDKKAYTHIPLCTYMVARAAAIDARLVNPGAADNPGSKLNVAVRRALEIYHSPEAQEHRGTQFIFADVANVNRLDKIREFMEGIGPEFDVDAEPESGEDGGDADATEAAATAEERWLYAEIARKLVAGGIPANEIAILHDYNERTRPELLAKVNAGAVRILMGSSDRGGIGLNVQERMIGLHHLDTPFMPAQLDQREARAVRFGNLYPEVHVINYGVKGTLDAALAAKIVRKSTGIQQFLSGAMTGVEFDDPAAPIVLSAKEQMAARSNDPRMMLMVELDSEVRTLKYQRQGHETNVLRARRAAGIKQEQAGRDLAEIARLNGITAHIEEWTKGKPVLQIGKEAYEAPEHPEMPDADRIVATLQKAMTAGRAVFDAKIEKDELALWDGFLSPGGKDDLDAYEFSTKLVLYGLPVSLYFGQRAVLGTNAKGETDLYREKAMRYVIRDPAGKVLDSGKIYGQGAADIVLIAAAPETLTGEAADRVRKLDDALWNAKQEITELEKIAEAQWPKEILYQNKSSELAAIRADMVQSDAAAAGREKRFTRGEGRMAGGSQALMPPTARPPTADRGTRYDWDNLVNMFDEALYPPVERELRATPSVAYQPQMPGVPTPATPNTVADGFGSTSTVEPWVVDRISDMQIIRAIEHTFGVPFRIGRVRVRKAAGIYQPGWRIIRHKAPWGGSISVATHEVAHHLDELYEITAKVRDTPMESELKALDYDPEELRDYEGFAEFIRHLLSRDDAKKVAPQFYQWFTTEWLPANPEILAKLEAVRGYIDRYRLEGLEAQVAAKVARDDAIERPISQGRLSWIGERVRTALRHGYQDLLDTGHTFNIFQQEARRRGWNGVAGTGPYDLFIATRGSAARAAQKAMEDGVVGLGAHHYWKTIGPSLRDVLHGLPEAEYETWVAFAYAKHAREAWDKNIDPGISREQAEHVYNQYRNREGWDARAEKLTELNNALLDMLVGAGVTSPSVAAALKLEWRTYLPLMRAPEQERAGGKASGNRYVNLGPALMGRKGSQLRIIDPVFSTVKRAIVLYQRAMNQEIMDALIQVASITPGMSDWLTPVPPGATKSAIALSEVADQLEAMGLDRAEIDTIIASADRAALTAAQAGQARTTREDTLFIWRADYRSSAGKRLVMHQRSGQMQMWEINNLDLYNTVTGLNRETMNTFFELLNRVSKTAKLSLTGLAINFALRNPINDYFAYIFRTEQSLLRPRTWVGPGEMLVSYLYSASAKMIGLKGDPYVEMWDEHGGKLANLLGTSYQSIERTVADVMQDSAKRRLYNIVRHPIDAVRDLISIPESIARIAEFAAVLRANGYDRARLRAGDLPPRHVLMQAVFAGKEVTGNFQRIGRVGRHVEAVIPFFNAGLQITDSNLRIARKRPLRALFYVLGMAAAGLAYWWRRKDDDSYQREQPWLKYGFYTVNDEHGRAIHRIPRGRELGQVSAMVEAMANAIYLKEPLEMKRWLGTALDMVNPVSWPVLVRPGLETFFNYDTFRDRPILTTYDQSREAQDQYNDRTLLTSRAIGAASKRVAEYLNEIAGTESPAAGFSPKQIEHLLEGYTFGMYRGVLKPVEKMLTGHGRTADMPVVSAFSISGEYQTSEEQLRQATDNARRAYNSANDRGEIPDELALRHHQLNAFTGLLDEIRKTIPRQADRDAQFVHEKWAIGLARFANGDPTVALYPNPLTGGADMPGAIADLVDKFLGRHAEQLARARPPERSKLDGWQRDVDEASAVLSGLDSGMIRAAYRSVMIARGVKPETRAANLRRLDARLSLVEP